jgi:putative DNA primase/helicase
MAHVGAHRYRAQSGEAMSDAEKIARALGGKRTADGFLCRCPVPGHGKGKGDRNPSLLVKDGERAPLVTCFGGCDARDILGALRRRGLLDGRGARPPTPRRAPSAQRPHTPDPQAMAAWRAACPGAGSIVETYLRGRGITVEIPSSIRCGTKLHLGRYELPTMVVAVQRSDGAIVSVQSTLLTATGKKASAAVSRVTVGALGSGAVRLAAVGEVLGIAEGVESALSAMQLAGVPCWACLGAARMQRVAFPVRVTELHIFADNDEAGRAAAERTAHVNRYRRIVLRFPPDGFKDWNDVLVAKGRAAA